VPGFIAALCLYEKTASSAQARDLSTFWGGNCGQNIPHRSAYLAVSAGYIALGIMSLSSALSLLLEEYPKAVTQPFAGHPMAALIREDLPRAMDEVLNGNPRYITNGSPGQGNWARTPWASVFDRFVTESAQDGYYIVYLVKEDFSGLYISLNQGVTSAKKQYGSEAKAALRVRASDFLARLGPLPAGVSTDAIDLAVSSASNLSSFYEAGNICSIFYKGRAIPDDAQLANDLASFVNLYFLLVSREPQLFERAEAEDDEVVLGEEDLTKLREHKRIERNRKLARKAKLHHGYTCKACGFDFQAKYGAIGKDFIEAHHLTPLADLKGQRLSLNAKTDFTVLCSNCHRIIHRTSFVNSVEEFRSHYLVKNNA